MPLHGDQRLGVGRTGLAQRRREFDERLPVLQRLMAAPQTLQYPRVLGGQRLQLTQRSQRFAPLPRRHPQIDTGQSRRRGSLRVLLPRLAEQFIALVKRAQLVGGSSGVQVVDGGRCNTPRGVHQQVLRLCPIAFLKQQQAAVGLPLRSAGAPSREQALAAQQAPEHNQQQAHGDIGSHQQRQTEPQARFQHRAIVGEHEIPRITRHEQAQEPTNNEDGAQQQCAGLHSPPRRTCRSAFKEADRSGSGTSSCTWRKSAKATRVS